MILCGGTGTRLREETESRPKPMVQIGGRPILWHIMKHYARHEFQDFVLCLGYKGHLIKDYFLNYDRLHADIRVSLGGNSVPEGLFGLAIIASLISLPSVVHGAAKPSSRDQSGL